MNSDDYLGKLRAINDQMAAANELANECYVTRRSLMVEAYENGVTFAEIAKACQISEPTVRMCVLTWGRGRHTQQARQARRHAGGPEIAPDGQAHAGTGGTLAMPQRTPERHARPDGARRRRAKAGAFKRNGGEHQATVRPMLARS